MFQGSLACGSCLKVAVAPPHTTSCQSSAKTRPRTLDLCCMPHHLAGCRQRSQQCAQARGQQQRVCSIHLSAGGHLQALGIRVMLSVPSADTDPLANVLLTIGRSEVSLTLHVRNYLVRGAQGGRSVSGHFGLPTRRKRRRKTKTP